MGGGAEVEEVKKEEGDGEEESISAFSPFFKHKSTLKVVKVEKTENRFERFESSAFANASTLLACIWPNFANWSCLKN